MYLRSQGITEWREGRRFREVICGMELDSMCGSEGRMGWFHAEGLGHLTCYVQVAGKCFSFAGRADPTLGGLLFCSSN